MDHYIKLLKLVFLHWDVHGIQLIKYVEFLQDVQHIHKLQMHFVKQFLLSVLQMAHNVSILYPVKITQLKRYAIVIILYDKVISRHLERKLVNGLILLVLI